MPPAVRRIAGASVVLFWVVLLMLTYVAGLSLLDGVLLAVLLVAVPGLSVAQLPLIEDAPLERLPAYWSSIATLWLLGTAGWFVGTREGGAGAIGLVRTPWVPLALWTVGLTLGGLLTILVFRQIGVVAGIGESPMLRQLLPRTHEERHAFGVLSVAAGFGEEIAYRGYAIPVLGPLLGVSGAAVLTSVVFGVLHGYQGALGILRTGAMGGMLAWGFLSSGSLWPPIIAHTLIDLVAGLWLGDKLLSPEHAPSVSEPDISPLEP
ncbi:MAG: CPBP family intramembrane metalloprotease [Gemmatimonadota bacterium]|nr:CPBP family intramembrane metalloprotease [Gemmatimonadota bacterium]MDH3422076.1 CPBP family intramembrane metalloprotease [Gemmatimonadota bacterium]